MGRLDHAGDGLSLFVHTNSSLLLVYTWFIWVFESFGILTSAPDITDLLCRCAMVMVSHLLYVPLSLILGQPFLHTCIASEVQ